VPPTADARVADGAPSAASDRPADGTTRLRTIASGTLPPVTTISFRNVAVSLRLTACSTMRP
jgi:hypothetical protein